MDRLILLSLDVEEFDTALEYGHMIPLEEQIAVSKAGLEPVLDVFEKRKSAATFFTTCVYALHEKEQIRQMTGRHEIASHGYHHGTFEDADLAKSKSVLEEITGKPIRGFRRARMAATDRKPIAAAGYAYNTSENPTWIPGRYNNFFKERRPYLADGLVNIPASVTPIVRFPLFWLSFKNFPMWMIKLATSRVLASDGAVNLYFHPWEFADLSGYRVPGYVKRHSGKALVDRLDEYVGWLGHQGRFATFGEYEQVIRASKK